MVKVKITYKDGSSRVFTFSTQDTFDIFLHNWKDAISKTEVL